MALALRHATEAPGSCASLSQHRGARVHSDKSRAARVTVEPEISEPILLKALKKTPGERYPTAEALRRYRNRLAVGAATLVLLTILVATGFSVRQAIEATRQRDRALALAARNEAVIDFVTSMLTEVAPAEQPVRVADLLERSQSILMQKDTLPEHRAAILGLLSGYYFSAGKPAQADALLSRSLELTQGTQDGELRAALLCDTAYAASLLGRPADAGKLIEQGLASSSPYPMAAVRCLRSRAYIAQNTNDPQAALEYALRAQARLKELPIPKPDIQAELFADIAAAKYLSGRSAEAEHPDTLRAAALSGSGAAVPDAGKRAPDYLSSNTPAATPATRQSSGAARDGLASRVVKVSRIPL
jgi:tetratricopeptide (TPR) repeat protein